jgi:hypothetical protein
MNLSFMDIAKGLLTRKYDIAICCYAYHLMEDGLRYDFLSCLALSAKKFIILSPSKKINIRHPMWTVIKELRIDKITLIISEAIL